MEGLRKFIFGSDQHVISLNDKSSFTSALYVHTCFVQESCSLMKELMQSFLFTSFQNLYGVKTTPCQLLLNFYFRFLRVISIAYFKIINGNVVFGPQPLVPFHPHSIWLVCLGMIAIPTGFFFFFFYAILQPNAPHLIKIHYILSFSLTSCFYLTPMLPVVYSNRRRWSLAKQLGLDVFTWLPHQTMFSCRIQLKREPENFVTGLFLFTFGHHRTHTLSLSLKCLEFTSY